MKIAKLRQSAHADDKSGEELDLASKAMRLQCKMPDSVHSTRRMRAAESSKRENRTFLMWDDTLFMYTTNSRRKDGIADSLLLEAVLPPCPLHFVS